jgi:hypothetical protein
MQANLGYTLVIVFLDAEGHEHIALLAHVRAESSNCWEFALKLFFDAYRGTNLTSEGVAFNLDLGPGLLDVLRRGYAFVNIHTCIEHRKVFDVAAMPPCVRVNAMCAEKPCKEVPK